MQMRTSVVVLLAALSLAPGRLTAAVQIGSFLSRPARSLSAFLAEVRRDRVLQQRYGRHLGVSWHKVPAYLGSHLRPGSVGTTAYFTVYNVTRDGEIFPTKQRLTAGTRIYRLTGSPCFFTQRGEPVRPFFIPVVSKVIRARPAPPPPPDVRVQRVEVPSE